MFIIELVLIILGLGLLTWSIIAKQYSLLLQIVVSVILLAVFIKFSDLDIAATIVQLKYTDLRYFALATLMFAITIFTNSYRWMKLARLLDYDLSYKHALSSYFESSFYNNFLPSNFGGDALRSYNLAKPTRSWLKAASTVFVERMFGFLVMFTLIPFGLIILRFSPFANAMPRQITDSLWLCFIGTVVGLASYKIWSRIPLRIIKKVNFAIQEYTKCHRSMVLVITWTFISHLFFLLGNVFSALAMGVGLEQVPFWYWLLMTPAATLAGFVIPAMKGVGAKEACFVYFLGLIGLSSNDSLAIAFVSFIAILLATLPGFPVIFRKIKLKKIIIEEQQHEAEELA